MGNKKSRLIKFKEAGSREPLYVNVDEIFSIAKSTGTIQGTVITNATSGIITVEEHITEVIAAIEDRDSLPAKVLFGNKDSE